MAGVSLFDSLLPARKAQPFGTAAALLPPWQSGQPLWSDWSTDKAITEGFKASVWVYRPISTLADAASSVPWFVERRLGPDQWERVDGHPLEALLENPNPFMSRRELFERMVQHLCLAGNACLLRIGTKRETRELWPLDVRWVKPIPHKTEWISGYEYQDGSTRQVFPAADVIHVLLPDPASPYWGLSPLQAAAKAVDTDVEAAAWSKLTLQSRLSAEGLLTFTQQLTRDQHDEIRQRLRERITGAGGDRLLVVGGEAKFTPMAATARDQEVTAQKQLTREELCLALGVPPIMYGIGDPTYSNMKTAERALWVQTVVPMLERFAGAFSRALIGNDPSLWLRYDLSGVEALAPDLERDARVYATLVQNRVEPAAAAEMIGLPLPEDAFTAPQVNPFANFGGLGDEEDEPEVEEPVVEDEIEDDTDEPEAKAFDASRRQAADEVNAAGDAQAGSIAAAFLRALREVRSGVPFDRVVEAIAAGQPDEAVRLLGLSKLTEAAATLAQRLASAFRAAGQATIGQIARSIGRALGWDQEQLADSWAVQRAADALTQIARASERAAELAVGSLIVGGVLHGKFTPEGIVALVKAGMGLTPQQEQALITKAVNLFEAGTAPQRVVKEVEKAAKKYSQERAALIALNESANAAREGVAQTVQEARNRGYLSNVRKEWVTVEDFGGDPCPVCAPMDGQTLPYDEYFVLEGTGRRVFQPGPEVHPLCRCGLLITEAAFA